MFLTTDLNAAQLGASYATNRSTPRCSSMPPHTAAAIFRFVSLGACAEIQFAVEPDLRFVCPGRLEA